MTIKMRWPSLLLSIFGCLSLVQGGEPPGETAQIVIEEYHGFHLRQIVLDLVREGTQTRCQPPRTLSRPLNLQELNGLNPPFAHEKVSDRCAQKVTWTKKIGNRRITSASTCNDNPTSITLLKVIQRCLI